MQSTIPFLMALSLASAAQLSLLPYAYLSAPFPVSHHFQDTRTGVHAYSYAGGPSAKEEIKDADGVLRGSYSYVDANGILQSVFYVADENGFRVAATNLPTDDNVEAEQGHIILARSADTKESTRRKRSVQDARQNSDQPEKKDIEAPVSQAKNLVEVQKVTAASSSQTIEPQGDVDEKRRTIVTRSLLQPVIPAIDIPAATSHQSQVQVHSNERIDLTQDEDDGKPVERQLILSAPAVFESLPVLARVPSYHENRIQLHRHLGIEGAEPKDAVKIDKAPIAVLPSSSVAVPLTSSVIAKEPVPILPVIPNESVPLIPTARLGTSTVTTSISSHGINQIHGPSRAAITVPNLIAKHAEPIAIANKDASGDGSVIAKEAVPIVRQGHPTTVTTTTSISSHGVSQIHGNSNIEPAVLVKATPFAGIHSLINVPVYLR